jgi:hypothetical protein
MLGVIFLTLLFFIVVLFSGFRLRRQGKPYGTLLLTIHKLIPVILLIYLAFAINLWKPLSPLTIAACLVAAVLFLVMIGSGGWISAAKEPPQSISILHKVFPYFTILAVAIVLILIFIQRL